MKNYGDMELDYLYASLCARSDRSHSTPHDQSRISNRIHCFRSYLGRFNSSTNCKHAEKRTDDNTGIGNFSDKVETNLVKST
jgi:hypothetical protein